MKYLFYNPRETNQRKMNQQYAELLRFIYMRSAPYGSYSLPDSFPSLSELEAERLLLLTIMDGCTLGDGSSCSL